MEIERNWNKGFLNWGFSCYNHRANCYSYWVTLQLHLNTVLVVFRMELQLYRMNSGSLLLYHFVGAPSSCSADPMLMIRRLTSQVLLTTVLWLDVFATNVWILMLKYQHVWPYIDDIDLLWTSYMLKYQFFWIFENVRLKEMFGRDILGYIFGYVW